MKVDRKEAEDLLRYCGYPIKDCSDEQLTDGISTLGNGEYDETTQAGSPEQTELLQSILYALKQGKPIELSSKEVDEETVVVESPPGEENVEEIYEVDEGSVPNTVENKETEMVPKKRGRGRPPKDPNKVSVKKVVVSRKRGRPKKEIKPLPKKLKRRSTRKLVERQSVSHNNKRKAGIISTIIEVLQKGSAKVPVTKEQVHAVLVKKFPDRDEKAMWNTVQSQIPTCLRWHKGIRVQRVKEKGERDRYWLPKDLSSVTGRAAKHKNK